MNNNTCVVIISVIINQLLISVPVFPSSVRSRCPAIILAVSRIANVPGRMMFLINSIHTMKGIKMFGVPNGTW